MIYTETLESLCELPNEDIGAIIRYINDWNNDKEVIIENPYHKAMWKIILPDLERNKETYLSIVERNKENGKKGGRPKKDETQNNPNNPVGFSGNPEKHNYNYNSINNSSKEELLNNNSQPSSPDGDEVVSKGLENLEKLFPQGRNKIGIDEINLWNSLTQDKKKLMIKWASVYIRNENKNQDGKFIKGIGKWMREQIEKGLEEKLPEVKNSTKSDDPRLLKMTDGTIYAIIYDKVNSSTKDADKVYHMLNKKDMFSTRAEILEFVKTLNKQEINELIK